jgi:uncharacterized protein YqhQ
MAENSKACFAKKTSIGGQALIEGIMMRGPKKSAMAVRNPHGEIVLEKWDNDIGNKKEGLIDKLRKIRFTIGAVTVEYLKRIPGLKTASFSSLNKAHPLLTKGILIPNGNSGISLYRLSRVGKNELHP